jgi:FMN-dependent NADH-azoreductase
MKKLLIINSSARLLHSHSRKLAEVFAQRWKNKHVNPIITSRELGNTNVPHIDENWISAAFTPKAIRSVEQAQMLKTSDAYISELREADVIALAAPMYNWSIPSVLKAYIDQILRIDETWKPNPANSLRPYEGLLENKTIYLLLSRGTLGYENGEYNAHMNFQSTYLKTVFNIMGISNMHIIAVNGTSLDAEQLKKSIATAHQQIKDLIESELAVLPRS